MDILSLVVGAVVGAGLFAGLLVVLSRQATESTEIDQVVDDALKTGVGVLTSTESGHVRRLAPGTYAVRVLPTLGELDR